MLCTRSRLSNIVVGAVPVRLVDLISIDRQAAAHGCESGRQGSHTVLHFFRAPLCLYPRPFQVLLPEYGGMQVKIDDKELFMFRCVSSAAAGIRRRRECVRA